MEPCSSSSSSSCCCCCVQSICSVTFQTLMKPQILYIKNCKQFI